jgi:hypothetical protein
MRKPIPIVLLCVLVSCAPSGRGAAGGTDMSFFITSVGPGQGANLGGLAGADAHCGQLAAAAGSRRTSWRAYLSTSAAGGQPAVNARDRIGAGPWYNARGVRVARDLAELHGEAAGLSKATSLDERGGVVNGRGDTPNRHDILTGSQLDGTAFADSADHSCSNWTSSDSGARTWATTTARAAARTPRRGTRRTARAAAARRTSAAPGGRAVLLLRALSAGARRGGDTFGRGRRRR